jgi:hypothetical protein
MNPPSGRPFLGVRFVNAISHQNLQQSRPALAFPPLQWRFQMQHINQTLLAQLADFGLNPREWRLEIKALPGAILKIQLFNKIEKGLVLQGFADRSTWLDLSYQG